MTGSQVPRVKPRGIQRKRDRYVAGGKPAAARRRAERKRTHTKPRKLTERSSPFVEGEDSTYRSVLEKPVRSPGVSGTARRDRNALNAGGLAWRGAQPQPDGQGRKPRWPGQTRSRT